MKPEIKERIEKINSGEVPEGYKRTKRGLIPYNWDIKKLGSVLKRERSKAVKVESERYYQQIGIRSHGKGIFYKEKVTGTELGNKSVFWLEPNCFIVNIVFAWEMAIAKTTENEVGMIASHRFPMYRVENNKLDLDYITLFFKSTLGKELLALASPGGAGRNKTLGQQEFLDLDIPLPVNVLEQKEIATIISTWDKAIELKEKLIEQKKQQKKWLMRNLLTGKVRLPGFDEKWEVVRLGDVGTTYNGLSGKNKDDFGDGKPYIPYKNVFINSKIDINYLDYVMINPEENQYKVKFGDIFFTTSSESPEEVGFTSVLLDKVDELYLNSFCFGYRLYDFNKILPQYVRFYFRGLEFRNQILKLAQGSTRFNLSKTEVMKVYLKVPCILEQSAIANILSNADKQISLHEQELSLLKQQKKGLMQLLLTGKVRVTCGN